MNEIMSHNNHHAICKTYERMNKREKLIFLLFTKHVFVFQNNNNIELLNQQHSNDFLHIMIETLNKHDFTAFTICKTYNDNFQLFNFIKNCALVMDYKSEIYNYIPDEVRRMFHNNSNNDVFEKFSKFIKIMLLLNFIAKTIKDKTPEDIREYNLIYKMNIIKPNLTIHLCCNDLNTPEQMQHFIDNYNYDWSCVNYLVCNLTDKECDIIHKTIELFL